MDTECRTKSERLFKELCRDHKIECTRLRELNDRRWPDYELNLKGQRVVFEVKQIQPNEDDKLYAKSLEHNGIAHQCRDPDVMANRVRNHIKKSRRQLNSYLAQHPDMPAILVLFDLAKNQCTDPYTIKIAMHGWERVEVAVSPSGQSPTVVDRGFGPYNNREVRLGKNQHLSALATLHECCDFDTHEEFLALCFYHNPFATRPFDSTWWQGDHISHWALGGKMAGSYQEWVRL